MSLTYHDVMRADMSSLLDAADMWKKMGKRFGELHANYRDNVRTLTGEDGPWTGGGAAAFGAQSTKTLHEFIAAKKQANAVASLLEDAHSQFTTLRKKVEKERDDAVAAGMKVDENGYCTYDFSDYTSTEKRAAVQAGGLATEENNWTNKISAAVKELSDADHGVKLALEAVSKDRDGKGADGGFNSSAKGDVEKYEGLRAAELGMRLNAGDELTQKQLQEFQRLNRDNSDNTVYSRTVLNSLGPEATVKLSNKLVARAHVDNASSGKQYLRIEKGLSAILATATTVAGSDENKRDDRQFRDAWLSDLKKIGAVEFAGPLESDEPLEGSSQKVLGYQSILTLIEHGNAESYSADFLQALGQDIYETEEQSKGNIWDLHQAYAGKGMAWFANDPMDSALGLMAEHPGTATEFLDPGEDGENNKLDYFMNKRDWDGITPEYEDWKGNTSSGIMEGHPEEDVDARKGFGAALEAATTGHEPLDREMDPRPQASHSHAQIRTMHEALVLLDEGSETEVPKNLREPLANALGEYTPDTHQILSGNPSDEGYITEAGGDGVFGDGRLAVKADTLTHVMRGLAEDPEAYGTMHKAESRYVSEQLDQLPGTAEGLERSGPLGQSGAALGAYSAIREDVVDDIRQAEHSAADWKAKAAYHIVGSAVTPLPGGDVAQRMVDTWTFAMSNDLKDEADTEANAKISDHYLKANNQINIMVHDWADKNGVPEKAGGVTGEILNGFDRGVLQADKYLAD